MSKPRAIRNRKSEMISCWVCAAFIAILFIGKNLLIGSGSMGVFNTALFICRMDFNFFVLYYPVF